MSTSASQRPVVFGEALFDRFPDGTRVLGGAPFNVAWHLQGFGYRPLFITAIGRDPDGRKLLDAMQGWGMETPGVQVVDDRPTGQVRVKLDNGQPSFDILPDQAYDHIDLDRALEALPDGRAGLLYHGTLAARHVHSGATLLGLRERLAAPVFLDVNLRAPWWRPDSLASMAGGVEWLKLNRDELAMLTPGQRTDAPLARRAQALCVAGHHRGLWLTCGEAGALFAQAQDTTWADAPPVEGLVDTVGAGDAFSAVAIAGLLEGWDEPLILRRAIAFAARICRQTGATSTDRTLYGSFPDFQIK